MTPAVAFLLPPQEAGPRAQQPAPMPTVLLASPMVDASGAEFLAARYRLVAAPDPNQLNASIAEADALFVRQDSIVGAGLIEAAPRLKVIASSGAGLDHIDVAAATRAGIVVTRAGAAGARSVAEHTVALMLALAKRLVWADACTRAGDFEVRWSAGSEEISGKILAVVGYGEIGRDVARICRDAFNMRVVAVAAPGATTPTDDRVTFLPLAEALAEAEIVSIHVQLTEQTRGLIGAREFGLMRPGAWLINTARGPIVDERALLQALRSGRLGAAGLDVFETEPPSPENPLFALDNVIVSPHNAGITKQAFKRMSMATAEAIDATLRGVRPRGFVNDEVWSNSRAATIREC